MSAPSDRKRDSSAPHSPRDVGSDPASARFAIDDTESWAHERLAQHWRQMGAIEKMAILSEHSVALERLSIAGLRIRYPDACAEELTQRAAALRVGRDDYARWTGREFEW